jgi:CDGSH-type Zn-finger protein
MVEVTIEARPNGPYVITGTIELRDTNGEVLPTRARTVLCRCGASTKKPFCDGTHSKVGFQAAAQAVPDSAESSAGSGAGGISAGDIGVPAAALDATESAGVISGVDPADVEKAATKTPPRRSNPS